MSLFQLLLHGIKKVPGANRRHPSLLHREAQLWQNKQHGCRRAGLEMSSQRGPSKSQALLLLTNPQKNFQSFTGDNSGPMRYVPFSISNNTVAQTGRNAMVFYQTKPDARKIFATDISFNIVVPAPIYFTSVTPETLSSQQEIKHPILSHISSLRCRKTHSLFLVFLF